MHGRDYKGRRDDPPAILCQDASAKKCVPGLIVCKPPESRIVEIRISVVEKAQGLLARGIMMFDISVRTYNIDHCVLLRQSNVLTVAALTTMNTHAHAHRDGRRRGEGHFNARCKENTKYCNCKGLHITISGSYLEREEIVKATQQKHCSIIRHNSRHTASSDMHI